MANLSASAAEEVANKTARVRKILKAILIVIAFAKPASAHPSGAIF